MLKQKLHQRTSMSDLCTADDNTQKLLNHACTSLHCHPSPLLRLVDLAALIVKSLFDLAHCLALRILRMLSDTSCTKEGTSRGKKEADLPGAGEICNSLALCRVALS